MAYPTIDEFKTFLAVEQTDSDKDTMLTNLLNAAIEYAEEYTGRNFSGNAVAITQIIQPDLIANDDSGKLLLYLKYDLMGVSEIRIGEESKVATAPIVDRTKIKIINRQFGIVKLDATLPDDAVVQVKYTYGNATTPQPVFQAILAKGVFLADNSGHADLRRVGNVQLGDLNTFFWATTSPPKAVDEALEPYKYIYI